MNCNEVSPIRITADYKVNFKSLNSMVLDLFEYIL